jgi:hypothetical protein
MSIKWRRHHRLVLLFAFLVAFCLLALEDTPIVAYTVAANEEHSVVDQTTTEIASQSVADPVVREDALLQRTELSDQ